MAAAEGRRSAEAGASVLGGLGGAAFLDPSLARVTWPMRRKAELRERWAAHLQKGLQLAYAEDRVRYVRELFEHIEQPRRELYDDPDGERLPVDPEIWRLVNRAARRG